MTTLTHYLPYSDTLTFLVDENVRYRTERVSNLLTVFRGKTDVELVGCMIKGVSTLAENARTTFDVEGDVIKIAFIIYGAAGGEEVDIYHSIREQVGDRVLKLSDLKPRDAGQHLATPA